MPKTSENEAMTFRSTDEIKDKQIKEKEKQEEKEKEKGKFEDNLIFKKRNISIFRLYYNTSGVLEIFLIIIAILATIVAGCSNAFKALLIGDSANDFTVASMLEYLEKVLSEEIIELIYAFVMDYVEPKINDKIKKFLIIGAIMFFANFIMMFLWSYTALRQMHWMKINYFRLILAQEQGWFDENNAYEFATKVQAQLEQIEMGVGDRVGQLIMIFVELVSGFVVAFLTSWKLTLVLLSCFPFIILGALIMGKCNEGVMIKSRKTYEKAGGLAEELLYNIKTVTTFVNFDFELQRFGDLIDKVEKLEQKKSFVSGIGVGIIIFGIFFGYTFSLLYARNILCEYNDFFYERYVVPPFTVGDVQKVLICVVGSIVAIGEMAPNIQVIKESCIAASDYFCLNDRIPHIYISEANLKPERENIKGKIEFKNIKFIYPSDKEKKPILDGLSFTIEPGKKIAFVGESGCGKSTTVNLISRFYEPNEGQILIDGIDIKEYNLDYLRSLIGYVQQEPVLFNKTIKDNLIFGREKELKELGDIDELIKEACTDAYIEDFIKKLPEKYEYQVGVKGSKLSGGQKQRIAIARAILAKPKILILDEATSALDNQSEKEVQKALDDISQKNVTTLIIAHKLNTIKNADIIFALKKGKVYEQGTHDELLAANGYYAELIKSQLGKKEEDEDNNNEILTLNKKKSKRINYLRKISSECNQVIEEIHKHELKIEEDEKKIKIDRKELMKLLDGHIFDLVIGTIGGFVYGAGTPVAGLFLGYTINALSPHEVTEEMWVEGLKWSLYHIGIAVVGGLSIFLKVWKLEGLGSIITSKMRKKVIQKYLELDMGFFDKDCNSPGSLLTKLSIDTTQISGLILNIFGSLISAIGALIIALALGFCFDWRLALITLCFTPFIIGSNVLKAYYRQNGKKGNKDVKIEAGSMLSECVINTKTIFSFNFKEEALKIYKNILDKETNSNLKDSLLSGFLIGIGVFITFACQAVVFRCSFIFMKERTLTYNNMNLAQKTLLTTNGISHSLLGLAEYPKAKAAFRSVFKILNTPSKINAFENENKDNIFPLEFKGKIELKNVSFAYPTKPDNLILKSLSLTIEAGQRAALVGFSGSGKSTVIQLIERLYDANSGEVLIDDINIKDYNLFELRKRIGIVSQEPVLFKRSVYENILYGKLEASKEEVYEAARKAVIDKFFNDEEKGEKNETVSGGEKQRLAIARAFLKNPTILLLDEATSALDKESEVEVQKSINELQKGRTSVSVAHRLGTIVDSDVIFVLESGRLVEKGTHKELIEKKGKYFTLYQYSEK